MPVDDPGQDIGEIGERIDVVDLTGLDQGRDISPMFGATVGSGKQRVLATELDAADRSFDRVVVEFDAAVIDEARQPPPARERVADSVGKLDLLADESQLGAQQVSKASASGRLFRCRTRRRSSALRPRISFSIA
jgi:hypothetical protein